MVHDTMIDNWDLNLADYKTLVVLKSNANWKPKVFNDFNYYRPIWGLKRTPHIFKSGGYTVGASLPMYGVHFRGPIEGSIKQNNYRNLLIKMRDPHDKAATSKLIS